MYGACPWRKIMGGAGRRDPFVLDKFYLQMLGAAHVPGPGGHGSRDGKLKRVVTRPARQGSRRWFVG